MCGRRPWENGAVPPPFLSALSKRARAGFEEIDGYLQVFEPKATILRAGDPPESVWLIEEGRVKVIAADARGHEVVVALYSPGSLVGIFEVLDPGDRIATVRAAERVTARRLPSAAFLGYLREYPEAWEIISRILVRYTRAANRARLAHHALSAPQRLALLLLDLNSGTDTSNASSAMTTPLTRAELAACIGVSESTVAAILKRWRQNRIISRNNKLITIDDPTRLWEVAGRPKWIF